VVQNVYMVHAQNKERLVYIQQRAHCCGISAIQLRAVSCVTGATMS